MTTKLQTIQNDYKLMRKLYPNMDKRKIKKQRIFQVFIQVALFC